MRVVCRFFLLGHEILSLGSWVGESIVRKGQSYLLNFAVLLEPCFRKGLEGPRGHGHGIDGKMLNTSQPFHQPPDFQRASLALGLLPLPPLLLIILVFLLPAASSPL